MLYMVVENFTDAVSVYRRFRDAGRLAPENLKYISSWVDVNFQKCFQIMETDDEKVLEEWMANWKDLVDFEVYPIVDSAEAAKRINSKL